MAGADFHQHPDKVSGSIRVRSKKSFSSCQKKMFSGSFMYSVSMKYVHVCVLLSYLVCITVYGLPFLADNRKYVAALSFILLNPVLNVM